MTCLPAALKQATLPYHKSLESKLGLLKPGFTPMDYLNLLKAFFGFYLPMEATFRQFPELFLWLPDLRLRSKLPLLEADLRALGMNRAEIDLIPRCARLPPCANSDAALGCLYVLEGSTLGGQFIGKHLKRAFGLDEGNGAAFFNGYGDNTQKMWERFKNKLSAAPADEKTAIVSACETFSALERWLYPSTI